MNAFARPELVLTVLRPCSSSERWTAQNPEVRSFLARAAIPKDRVLSVAGAVVTCH